MQTTKVQLALRPADVTCEKCWLLMLARHMVTLDEIPVTMNFGLPRKLLLELGLPVAQLRRKGDGLPPMTRDETSAAKRQIPLAEVRRMLAERTG